MDIEKLKEELVGDEGEVLHAYQDSRGYWTIGVGQLIDARAGGRISQAASRFMLAESIEEKAIELDRRLPWWRNLSDARQRVLLNMAFNLGVGGLMGFVATLDSLDHGNYEEAAAHMLSSKWAEQVGDRAVRLAKMMREG